MAYKFQLGDARLSGSIVAEGDLTAESSVVSGSELSGAAIALGDASGLADEGLSNASGKLALDIGGMNAAVTSTGDVGDADELAISDGGITKKIDFSVLRDAGFSAVSGDATIAAGGALTIAANAVEGSMLNSDVVASDGGIELSSSALQIKLSGSGAELAVDAGGLRVSDKLAALSGLAVTDGGIIVGDGSTFVLESGATARTSLGLAIGSDVQAYDAQLADIAGLATTDGGIIVGDGNNFVLESGATARASLGLTIGTDVQAYDAQLADIAALSPTDSNFIVGDGSNFVLESGATVRTSLGLGTGDSPQFTGLTLTGDLVVSGTTTTINSTELTIDDRVIRIGDGLADLAAAVASGSGFEIGDDLASFKLNTDIDGGGTDGFASSVPLSASAYYGDGSNLSNVSAQTANGITFRTYSTASASPISLAGNAGFYGPNTTDGSSANAITLHLSGAWSAGDVVYVKAYNNVVADSRNLTILSSGSQTIDGFSSAVLESDGAAISLIYNGAGWNIF